MADESGLLRFTIEKFGKTYHSVTIHNAQNLIAFEGVLSTPPQRLRRRDNGKLLPAVRFSVCHKPVHRNESGRLFHGRPIAVVFLARNEVADQVERLQVGDFVVIRGRFQYGGSRSPQAMSVEHIADTSSRVIVSPEDLLDGLMAPPKKKQLKRRQGSRPYHAITERQKSRLLLDYINEGWSATHLSIKYNVGVHVVYRVLREWGVTFDRKRRKRPGDGEEAASGPAN